MSQTEIAETNPVDAAMNTLVALGFPAKQFSPLHSQVGLYSFYPTTGTILISGGKPLAAKGLPGFIEVLTRIRNRNPKLFPQASPTRLKLYEARLRRKSPAT